MDRWNGKVAVVTGASAGIGASIVVELLKSNMIVVGLARRKEKVEALQGQVPTGKLHALKCDVSIESDVKTAFEWIDANLGGTDVLISNAGVLHFFHLTDADNTEMLQQTVNTNLLGTVYCAREAFQSMKRRNFDGHIVLMNSVAGHRVPFFLSLNRTAFLNAYHSTKHGLTAMVEVLRQEFQQFGTKIKISVGQHLMCVLKCFDNNALYFCFLCWLEH